MSSDLIIIGRAGTIAARSALEVTAQNIANADNPDYARRRVTQTELLATGSIGGFSSSSLGGVRIDEIQRSDAVFLQNQARRTGSDLARADAELSGLLAVETAIDQTGIFPAIVDFEASLAELQSDPLNGALRSAVLESGRALSETLNIANRTLAQSGEQLRFEANSGVEQVNLYAGELARINAEIVRTEPGTSSFAALLDQRDSALSQMSDQLGIAVEYDINGTVAVRQGDASGPLLVSGTNSSPLALTTNADGTVNFTVGGAAVTLASGQLAGQAQALLTQRDYGQRLDDLAALTVTQVNAAQANGAAPDGTAGQPFFSGSTAGDITVALASGAGIATAAAGSPAQSRDTSNLEALRSTLASNTGPASEADSLLFDLANAVRSREVTRDATAIIAETAQTALVAETGVDLEQEAVNLVRFQQAFQASSRVIQTANDIFNSILGIRS
ncbi:flagellar hook-associated protein FlgK [Erythrobacter sp. HA6-11]